MFINIIDLQMLCDEISTVPKLERFKHFTPYCLLSQCIVFCVTDCCRENSLLFLQKIENREKNSEPSLRYCLIPALHWNLISKWPISWSLEEKMETGPTCNTDYKIIASQLQNYTTLSERSEAESGRVLFFFSHILALICQFLTYLFCPLVCHLFTSPIVSLEILLLIYYL